MFVSYNNSDAVPRGVGIVIPVGKVELVRGFKLVIAIKSNN